MDLILYNSSREAVKVLKNYEFDCSVGKSSKSDNDFQLVLYEEQIPLGYWIEAQGTEFGGRITGRKYNSATRKWVYTGRSFRGMLDLQIPYPFESHIESVNYADEVFKSVKNKTNYSSLISSAHIRRDSDVTPKISPFLKLGDSLLDALESIERIIQVKSIIRLDSGYLDFTFKKAVNLTNSGKWDASQGTLEFEENLPINTIYGVTTDSSGNRLTATYYIHPNGTVNSTLSDSERGVNSIARSYQPYGNTETQTELDNACKDKLREGFKVDSGNLAIIGEDADICDRVTISVAELGLQKNAMISEKILKATDDDWYIEYQATEVV